MSLLFFSILFYLLAFVQGRLSNSDSAYNFFFSQCVSKNLTTKHDHKNLSATERLNERFIYGPGNLIVEAETTEQF